MYVCCWSTVTTTTNYPKSIIVNGNSFVLSTLHPTKSFHFLFTQQALTPRITLQPYASFSALDNTNLIIHYSLSLYKLFLYVKIVLGFQYIILEANFHMLICQMFVTYNIYYFCRKRKRNIALLLYQNKSKQFCNQHCKYLLLQCPCLQYQLLLLRFENMFAIIYFFSKCLCGYRYQY